MTYEPLQIVREFCGFFFHERIFIKRPMGIKSFRGGGIMDKNNGKFNSFTNAYIRVLSLASLFEEAFSIDWLMQLSDSKASHVLSNLEKAVQKKLLINAGSGLYRFSNLKAKSDFRALLSTQEQEKVHRMISHILFNEPFDDEKKAGLLASHLLRLSNDKEGCSWLIRAGNIYRKKFNFEKAVELYNKAIDDLSKMDQIESNKLFIEAAINYSKTSTARQNTTKVLKILREAITRANRSGNETCKVLLEMHMAKTEWLRSGYGSAFKHFKKGWAMAGELNDPSLMPSVKTFSTFFLYWQGLFRDAVASYEEVVPTIQKYPRHRFPLLGALTVGHCYAQIGQVTQGVGMMDGIYKYCRENGDQYLAAHAEFLIGASMLDVRRIDDAFQYLELSLKGADKGHNEWTKILGRVTMAFAYYLKGDMKQSVRYLQDFLSHSSRVDVTVQIFPYLLELCWAMEEGKLPRISGLKFDMEIKRAVRSQNYFLKGIACKYLALQKKREGSPHEKIIQLLRTSLEKLEKSGHQLELARSRIELARQLLLIGHEKKAKEVTLQASKVLSSFNESLVPDDLRSIIKAPFGGEGMLKEILKISQEVVTIQNSNDLFKHILSTVNRVTGAERGAMFFLEGDVESPKINLRASKNLTSSQIEDPKFESSLKLVEKVVSTRKGLIVNTDSPEKKAFLTSDRIRSKICVPMIIKKKVLGVLYHDNRILSSVFKESDLELLTYFAALSAFAVDNAMAYEKIHKLNYELRQEKQYYQEQNLQRVHFEEIVGESHAINHVLEQISQVAKTDATVLILGETGVGKDLVARAIHRKSSRNDKPFIQVNCNALPDSLLPSELFGHERGAFTGAIEQRTGRFELANGGTIFLDEIGDISLDVQIRLLRILQTKEFERVGGTKTIRSDFRLISATNRDLEKKIKEETFRADLFYRLNVFPMHIPPLRKRKEDIPLLVNFFVQIHSKRTGKRFKVIPKEEIERLIQYDWPGNVRELENIIERSVVLSKYPHLKVPELGNIILDKGNSIPGKTLKEAERQQIVWALNKAVWKVKGSNGAAQLLDINPSTLFFKMKRLGIERPESLPIRRGTRSRDRKDVHPKKENQQPRT